MTHSNPRDERTRRALSRTALLAALITAGVALSGCSDSPETLLAKARESTERKDTKAAEIHLKNLLQKEDSPEARFLLGNAYLQNGDFVSAEKELRRAQEGGFDPKRLALALTDAYMKMGNAKRALEEAAKASPDSPADKARLATLTARAQMMTGKPDAARASFEAALAGAPDYGPARVGLLVLRAAAGDAKQVGVELDALLTKEPKLAEALALKGDLEMAAGHPKEARDAYAKAADADPMDRSSRSRIVLIGIGLKEFEAAQKALDDLRKITGAAPVTMQMQAELHLRNGKPELARDAIQAALKGAPDYPPIMALGAEIFLKTNAVEQAERLSRMLVEKAPEASIGYRLLGTTLIQMNAPDKALQALQPALDKGSKDPLLYTIAGEAALRLNDTPRAMTLFEKAGALDPKATGAKTGLAMAHLARGDTERGIAELEKVSEAETGSNQADLILVSTHLRARQFDKALAAVERLALKQPDSVLPDNLRGTVLLAKGDAAGARKAFEQALQRDPKFFAAAANLAALDLRERKPDDARKRFTTLLEKDPKNVLAMVALGRLALIGATRETADATRAQAIDWYRKAHDADRSSLPATVALAGALITGKQYADAIPMLQEALAANPNSIELLDMLGSTYLQSDQQSLGMETLEKILRVRPGDSSLQFRMGELKLRLGDTTGALVHLRKSAELAPKAIEPRVAIAGVLARTGKIDEARKISAALQKEAPKSALGIMLEGDLFMGERKFAEAAATYRRALAVQKAVPLQTKLHQAVIAMGKLDEADTLITEFVKESPADIGLTLYAGDYEMARKRWPAAIAYYGKVLAAQPGNAIALNNQAWVMLQANDPKALAVAEKALQQAPNSAAIMDTLGMILLAQGTNERGLLMLKQAVSTAPRDARIRMNLAEALARTGDKAGAAVQIDAVINAAPKSPEAARAQELRKKL